MTEYEILSFIHSQGDSATTSAFTAESINSKEMELLSDRKKLEHLIEMKLVEADPQNPHQLRLTGIGLFRLDALSQAEKEKVRQRHFEIFLTLLSALAGAILSKPLWHWLG